MNRPFYEDDDDASFGNRNNLSRGSNPTDELSRVQQKIGHVENESLESTYRALRSLNETREIGVKTAEELVRQGEKLSNIDQKLDEVDQTLTLTQKNINQIKSVFGGIKNRFFNWSSNSSQPSASGTIKESKTLDSISTSKSTGPSNSSQKADLPIITGSDREKEINKNLEEMSTGLSHLKSLASDMQLELDRQNPLIERITEKTDKTYGKIESQNAQMKKIK